MIPSSYVLLETNKVNRENRGRDESTHRKLNWRLMIIIDLLEEAFVVAFLNKTLLSNLQ